MAIVSRSMFPLQTSFTQLQKMQSRLSELQVQLATGQKASTLAGMGNTRPTSLNLRSQINTLSSYSQSISTVNLRLATMTKVIERMDVIESEARNSSMPGGYGTNGINLAMAPGTARARLDEVLTLANTDINGRYIFGGTTTDKPPVATINEALDGQGGKFGFKDYASQRLAADQGVPDGTGAYTGRLTVGGGGTTVTLDEDGSHPFGFKLSSLTVPPGTSPGMVLTTPGGSPASLGVDFVAQPREGETVTIGFTMPDGTETKITLTATTTSPPGKGQFEIGATEADTAASFSTAMTDSIHRLASGELVAASNYAAADSFFAGAGETVMRIDGPPYDTATGLIAATEADTVMWYKGGDTNPARQSVTAKIDDNTTVAYGVQANEDGINELIKSLAVFSISSFPDADENARARYDGLATRQMGRLSEANNSKQGSLEMISAELGMAQSTVKSTSDRQKTYGGQLQNLLTDIEQVTPENVAMELMAVKTRLEASYSVTSMVSQLSLVNFMK